jgi:acetyl esterase/lipase
MQRKGIRFAPMAIALCCLFGAISAHAQLSEKQSWAVTLAGQYAINANVTYATANNVDLKLDVYRPKDTNMHPTMLFFHGGGMVGGNKEGSAFALLPFLEKGWTVVNVEYRLAKISRAPASVEDGRCALRWVYQHAKDFNFDTSRIVTMGQSAGGNLAMLLGYLPADSDFDRQCTGPENLKVAAVLDWYGVSDWNDLLEGANQRPYAVTWFGSQPDRAQIAKSVSPLTYIRAGLPPTLMIQGNEDPNVPFTQSLRLQKALTDASVPNQLVTIQAKTHGNFNDAAMNDAYTQLWAFLAKYLPGQLQSSASQH